MAGIKTLAIVAAVAAIATITEANHNITSPIVTNWGEWGRMQRCPSGRYAQAMQLKVEPNQLWEDDSALNAIRLFCGDPFRPDTAVITSTVGDFGTWGQITSCFPAMIAGFQLRSEPNRGNAVDDTAANNLKIVCSDNRNEYLEGDGMSWGSYTEPQHCFSDEGVCAIQTQVEPDQGSGPENDDTALNNLRLECCDVNAKAAAVDPNEKYLTVADLDILPKGLNGRFLRASLVKESDDVKN